MRIVVDSQAANDPDSYRWLDRILYRIEDGWHVWDTTDDEDTAAVLATTWISDRGTQGEWVRSMLVAAIRRDAWSSVPHGRSMRVTDFPRAADELTPEDACRLADEPLCILVENRISDGAFVERIVKELDESLRNLWDRPGEPIRVDSVGGKGQMSDEVERRSHGRPYRPRLVAIVDSERRAPGATPDAAANRLDRACARANLPCWILAKREAENYLPLVLLNAWQGVGADYRQRVAAWDRLTDDQKNFFDMKRGLSETPSVDEKALFDGLSTADRAVLYDGFGRNVYACWNLWHVPAKQELTIRAQGDLERGIRLIRKEV